MMRSLVRYTYWFKGGFAISCKYHLLGKSYPSVVGLKNGGFVVVFGSQNDTNSQDGSGWGVFGQRFDSSGTKVGTEFQVNSYTTGNQSSSNNGPQITELTNGGYAITWTSVGQDSDSSNGIYMQLFDKNGNGCQEEQVL